MDLAQFMEIWEQPEATRSKAASAFHEGWGDFVSWHSMQAVRGSNGAALDCVHFDSGFRDEPAV